ncbi:hypothetical protein [Methylobacterium soli]|uniref:hypothetical protein n=1 Tax=Methylobacterium soli TaxID=553447 RepID=UPI001246E620|nr:hypothetical protein [Methylobacterium soli]
MNRRILLSILGGSLSPIYTGAASGSRLAEAPVDVLGEWHAPPAAVARVVTRVRDACVSGFRLLSDQQPHSLRVESRPSGQPAIWLHEAPSDTAWVFVDIGERAWSQLAYQLGHELGHVVCNSWNVQAAPSPPCQWIEEASAEAFSLRGLGLLAEAWRRDPPFGGDSGYARSIFEYRDHTLEGYNELASSQGLKNVRAWFKKHRHEIEADNGLSEYAKAAATVILREIERAPILLEDLGAMNRWTERTSIPLNNFLEKWSASCRAIHSTGRLPNLIRENFLGT